MTWSESVASLEDPSQAFNVGSPLTVKQLLQCARLLKETNALPLSQLVGELELDVEEDNHHFLSNMVEQLLMNMPVLSVCRGDSGDVCC